ncbi:hypothetical protein GCM10010254_07750 [Streptomyces chromofuscus]|nr:hypothetical protein GCM10010254_07750 [Streptomyces chromofuscus]
MYAVEELSHLRCPWCIADGSAAAKYDAHFIGDPVGDDVPLEVVMPVDAGTPGFSFWQDPRWFFHCGDGTAFMGAVGAAELAAFPDAREELRSEAGVWGWSAGAVESYLGALDKDSQPTGYLFKCRTCGRYMAYADSRSRSQTAAATAGSSRWRSRMGGPSSGDARRGCRRGCRGGGPGR